MVWELNITTGELSIQRRETRECGPSWQTEQASVWAAVEVLKGLFLPFKV